MGQNLYMDDENLRLNVEVQPFLIDEIEDKKNIVERCAASITQSTENINTLKTNFELFYADAYNTFSGFYNQSLEIFTSVKNSAINSINTLAQQLIGSIQEIGQNIINQIRNSADQVSDTVNNNVSFEYLNQSKSAETGNISEDSHIIPFINKYAHSTFDRSKFTVVGSPVITDDGIASGFSSGNYLSISATTFNPKTSTWEIRGAFLVTQFAATQIIFTKTQNTYFGIRLLIGTNQRLSLEVSNNGTSNAFSVSSTSTITNNQKYYFKLYFTGNQYKLDISTDKSNWITFITQDSITTIYDDTSNIFTIGAKGSQYLDGSFDIKQFSITVDGVEVFSGNKTGKDTIKPDDYTVVGTPTISADGVASGFTTSDYLTDNISLGSGEWDITVPYKTGSTNPNEGIIFYISACGVFYYNNDIYFSVRDGNSQHILNAHFTPNANTNYLFRLSYIGGTYKAEYSTDNGVTYNSLGTNTTSSIARDAATSQTFYIGGNTGSACNGSIDLNLLKIYIAEDLVYQPCLKIPYTESKTGSKIVDAVYRDRVTDMYEQFGYAPYYTLGENDFTLPMGEIYGMMEKYKANIIQMLNQ